MNEQQPLTGVSSLEPEDDDIEAFQRCRNCREGICLPYKCVKNVPKEAFVLFVRMLFEMDNSGLLRAKRGYLEEMMGLGTITINNCLRSLEERKLVEVFTNDEARLVYIQNSSDYTCNGMDGAAFSGEIFECHIPIVTPGDDNKASDVDTDLEAS